MTCRASISVPLGRRRFRETAAMTGVGGRDMKSIVLWALGVPITVIILLNVFHVL